MLSMLDRTRFARLAVICYLVIVLFALLGRLQ
jgi:hypothetical protein